MRALLPVVAVVAVFGASGCEKAPSKPSPEPDVAEPEDLLVRVSAASGTAVLERARGYAEAISPGSGASLDPLVLSKGLAFAVQTPQLDGIDPGKPLHLLLLDPKKLARPVVIVVAVTDEAKVKAASNVAVELKGGYAVIGEASAVKAAAAYGFAVAKTAPPASPTVTVSPSKLVTRYRAEIDGFRKSMGQIMGTQSPAMARVLDAEIDLFMRIADQSERLQLIVDVQGDEAFFELALVPKKDTTLARFTAVQKPGVDPALLQRLPAVEKPSMVMAGHYELGPARDPMLDLIGGVFESLSGQKMDAGLRAKLTALFDMFTGDLAAIAWSGPTGGFQMFETVGATDGAKAVAMSREALAAVFGAPRDVEVMGMKMSWSAKAGAATHDGVSIDEYAVKLDLSTLPEMQREMLRKMYGEEGMHIYVAGFDKTVAVTIGTEGAASMPKLIDAVRKGGGAKPTPAAAAVLAAAAKRKSSVAMVMDYAQMLAPMLGGNAPASASAVAVDFGFADGAMRLRFGVPATHVKEIMGLMKSPR